jgi:hypothetical protein
MNIAEIALIGLFDRCGHLTGEMCFSHEKLARFIWQLACTPTNEKKMCALSFVAGHGIEVEAETLETLFKANDIRSETALVEWVAKHKDERIVNDYYL